MTDLDLPIFENPTARRGSRNPQPPTQSPSFQSTGLSSPLTLQSPDTTVDDQRSTEETLRQRGAGLRQRFTAFKRHILDEVEDELASYAERLDDLTMGDLAREIAHDLLRRYPKDINVYGRTPAPHTRPTTESPVVTAARATNPLSSWRASTKERPIGTVNNPLSNWHASMKQPPVTTVDDRSVATVARPGDEDSDLKILPRDPEPTPARPKTVVSRAPWNKNTGVANSLTAEARTQKGSIHYTSLELDYIFRRPNVGPGWFILRCDEFRFMNPGYPYWVHHFYRDPFDVGPKRMSWATRHFIGRVACHGGKPVQRMTNDQMVQVFGYEAKPSKRKGITIKDSGSASDDAESPAKNAVKRKSFLTDDNSESDDSEDLAEHIVKREGEANARFPEARSQAEPSIAPPKAKPSRRKTSFRVEGNSASDDSEGLAENIVKREDKANVKEDEKAVEKIHGRPDWISVGTWTMSEGGVALDESRQAMDKSNKPRTSCDKPAATATRHRRKDSKRLDKDLPRSPTTTPEDNPPYRTTRPSRRKRRRRRRKKGRTLDCARDGNSDDDEERGGKPSTAPAADPRT
ncbi:hypothetical protein B0T19DRAFT_398037 [Cercophora scortea]|uniref:Uncharacterized protein n=1 Tax=Cercophora scortea TaxID=314031 RepID=A0AAE0IVY1_9PEZI|nr:hypothetical protein B0T19DRAFT_398037 [Cercophora scortea]